MGLIFPGIANFNARTRYKTFVGGTASASDLNFIIAFLNGANDYTWTIPAGVFTPETWEVLRKSGDGDITIARGAGVTFLHDDFVNVDVKLDGKYGYPLYLEMIQETFSSGSIQVDSSGNYVVSEFPFGRAIGQKILVSGFTNAENNGIKTIDGLPDAGTISVAETLVEEGTGTSRIIIPQDTFMLSGPMKAAA